MTLITYQFKSFKLVVVACVTLLITGAFIGCGVGSGESDILKRFFSASRMGDRTTAGNIAMVAFDPDTDGTIRNFSVISVSEEQQRSLQMLELADELAIAQASTQEHAVSMRVYQDENIEAIARVIEAEREDTTVASRDEEVQAAWTNWREEAQDFTRSVSAAQTALNDESRIAEVSTFNPANPIDVRQYEGQLLTKEVSINATVEQGDSSDDRTLSIVLQKVQLGAGDETIDGRWIITSLQ